MAKNLKAAVLGSPISHSKSPQLHLAAYRILGLDIDYTREEVTEQTLEQFMAGLREERDNGAQTVGLSVTMPLKTAMVTQVDNVDKLVTELGVLNTVVFDDQGRTQGYNTDVQGIVDALNFAGFDAQSAPGPMAILGAGGTASATIAAARAMGIPWVEIYGRTPSRVQQQVMLAGRLGLEAVYRPLSEFGQHLQHYSAVVSTLPPRAADPYVHNIATGQRLPALLDVAYDPWPSQLATTWHQHQGAVVSGLEMLLYQAVMQVRYFTQRHLAKDTQPDWAKVTEQMAQAVGLPSRENFMKG